MVFLANIKWCYIKCSRSRHAKSKLHFSPPGIFIHMYESNLRQFLIRFRQRFLYAIMVLWMPCLSLGWVLHK